MKTDVVIKFECPTCGAQPGEDCFNLIRPGRTNRHPHKERAQKAMNRVLELVQIFGGSR